MLSLSILNRFRPTKSSDNSIEDSLAFRGWYPDTPYAPGEEVCLYFPIIKETWWMLEITQISKDHWITPSGWYLSRDTWCIPVMWR